MMANLRTRASALCAALCGAACMLSAWQAGAAEPQWPDRPVTLQAQDQPIADFLGELLRSAGMRALPSDAVTGRISGRFSDPPEKIFNDVVKAYDLLPYFDGAAMHVSAGREMQSRTIRVPPAEMERVARALSNNTLADRYQSLRFAKNEGVVRVRGAPEFVDDVQQLISGGGRNAAGAPAALRPAPASTPRAFVVRSFPLKYASAADQTFYQSGQEMRIPGVVTLLRSMTGDAAPLIPASLTSEPRRAGGMESVRGRGLRRFDERDANAQGLRPPEAAAQAPAMMGGGEESGVRIEADPNLNTVLVRDSADAMATYEQLIAQLDKEPQLVEIQVTIIDVDRSKLQDVGVDWQYQSRKASVAAGGGDAGAQNGGLLLNTVLGDAGNFLARVNALARNGSANVISRPQVLTLSNLEAVLATDQSFFVRVAGNEDVDLFDVSVGTSLRVVPTIAGDAGSPQIRLRVGIEDGSLSPDARVDDIPIVERSSLNTQAVIYDGQSLLLGGLSRDEASKDTTKVPLLGDVPGVGKLFRRTTSASSSRERLFLISPRVVATNHTPAATPPQQPGATPGADVTVSRTAPAPPPRSSQGTSQPGQGYLNGF
jgi:type III secretion protein C